MYALNFGYGVPGALGGLGAGYLQPSFMVSNNGILYFGRIKKPSDEKKRVRKPKTKRTTRKKVKTKKKVNKKVKKVNKKTKRR